MGAFRLNQGLGPAIHPSVHVDYDRLREVCWALNLTLPSPVVDIINLAIPLIPLLQTVLL